MNENTKVIRSIAFPNIFNGSTINLYTDYDAIKSNLQLLLSADRGALYGDPHYGTNLRKLLFEQAYSPMLQELIKDEIYESVFSYLPQITVDRDSIKINVIDNIVSASINVTSDSGVESNLYEITLLNGDE